MTQQSQMDFVPSEPLPSPWGITRFLQSFLVYCKGAFWRCQFSSLYIKKCKGLSGGNRKLECRTSTPVQDTWSDRILTGLHYRTHWKAQSWQLFPMGQWKELLGAEQLSQHWILGTTGTEKDQFWPRRISFGLPSSFSACSLNFCQSKELVVTIFQWQKGCRWRNWSSSRTVEARKFWGGPFHPSISLLSGSFKYLGKEEKSNFKMDSKVIIL